MGQSNAETLDIAMLPLVDGRQVVIPLAALAEVKQVRVTDESGSEFGTLRWRGQELPINALDSFCGLQAAAADQYTTVGVFRAGKDSGRPFRALAFCGIAAHARVEPYELEPIDTPDQGHFAAAAEMDGQTYLVPDLPGLMFTVQAEAMH
jgi:hypothetical protein